jgi:L-iditol 2-dehydrogenase
MIAVQAVGPRRVETVEAPMPSAGEHEVLIRTEFASICGSDLHQIWHGWNVKSWPQPPGYPGHEGVGEVVESRSERFKPGDHVLTVPHFLISRCFAAYQSVHQRYLVKLPEGRPRKPLLMAQQLATVIFAARQLPPLVGKTCVVLGQGSAGLFWDFVLRRSGAERIIAVDPIGHRLQVGQRMGAHSSMDVTGPAATATLGELTGGGADVVVEAVGSATTLSQAFDIVRPGGTVVLFGLPESDGPVPFRFDAFFRKRCVAYTCHGSQDEPGLVAVRLALDWIASGQIDMAPVLTHFFPASKAQQAFELAASPSDGAVKVTLTFQ